MEVLGQAGASERERAGQAGLGEAAANSLLLTVGSAASKLLGFGREMAIAWSFGASRLVDAYLVASTVPMMLFTVVGSSLSTTLIPLVTQYEERQGRVSVLAMVDSITSAVAVLLSLLVLAGELLAPWLVLLVAPGFAGEARALATGLSRVMFPIILFMGLAGIGTGLLQANRRFLFPAFIGIPYNLVIIAAVLLLGRRWGVTGLALATVAGVAAQWLFQVPDLRRAGFRYRPHLDLSHPGLRQMGRLVVPVIIGAGAAQINLVVDRILASGLAEGSIAALNYAGRLNGMLLGVLAAAVAQAVYPELAQAAVAMDHAWFRRGLVRSLNALLLVMLPVAAGILLLAGPMVRVAFQRGAFDERAVELTVFALVFYALGLPAMALREIAVRAFYSLQDTWTPMRIGIATVALNVVLCLLLVRPLAHGGLALATSLSLTAGYAALLWALRRKVGSIGGRELLVSGSKMLFATLVMSAAVAALLRYLPRLGLQGLAGQALPLFAGAGLGAAVYFALIWALRVTEFEWVLERVRRRLPRKHREKM
jgi:putative peptidoglycan lipid II flippase